MTTKGPKSPNPPPQSGQAAALAAARPRVASADLVLLLVMVAVWVFWFLPVLRYWDIQWFMKDSYYIHGPLIPLITLMLIWTSKDKLLAAQKRTDWRGLVIVLAAALVRFVGDWAGIVALGSFAFPPLVFGLVWFMFGPKIARLCLFPIGFLFFMCPIPSTLLTNISYPLQLWSTVAAAQTMNLLGYQVVRTGVEISTASGAEVMVGQACSGFRLLVTMLAAAAIFTYLFDAPVRRKVLLVVLTLPLALLGNAVRVWVLVFVADRWGEEAMHKAHDASGYLVVVLACLLFIGLMRLLECRDSKKPQPSQ
jgi:exosortase